jgi:hypothetical protein
MNEVKLRQRFHGKLVIASHDYMHALANAGATIAVNDPAFFNVQFVVGNLDEQVAAAFCDGIDRHEVDYLVLPIALNDWFDSRPSSFRGALNNQFSLYYFRAFLTSRFKLDYLMVGSEQEVWYVYRNTAGQKTATAP